MRKIIPIIFLAVVVLFSAASAAEQFPADPNSCGGYEEVVRTYNKWITSDNPCETAAAEHLAEWLGFVVALELAGNLAAGIEESNKIMDEGIREVGDTLDFIIEDTLKDICPTASGPP